MSFEPQSGLGNKHNQQPIMKAFFKAQSIQNLSQNEKDRLVQIIKTFEEEQQLRNTLQNYQKKKLLDISQLQRQIQLIMNDRRLNIDTIIFQILKCKQKEETTSQYINRYLSRIQYFKNHSIIIQSTDGENNIKGKISSISLINENKILLDINQARNLIYKAELYLKNNFISKVKIESAKVQNLGDWLRYQSQNITSRKQVFQNIKTLVNSDHSGQLTSILPEGNYDIILYLNKARRVQEITFVGSRKKEITFSLKQNQLNDLIVQNQAWQTGVHYEQFCRFFKIEHKQTVIIEYKSEQESNSSITIRKDQSEQSNMFEIMQKINRLKSELGGILRKQQDLLAIFLDKLISCQDFTKQKEFVFQQISRHGVDNINTMLYELVALHQQLGTVVSIEKVLRQVLIEINYSLLVPKSGTVDTVRIVSLLAEAQRSLKLVQNKDIISFYGSTGSGKSTSVNYFTGIPLKKQPNKYDDKVVKIDEQKYNNLLRSTSNLSANIGHSIGTSETIYSKGYKFIEDTLSQDLKPLCKNIILCDNPGFHDTRGTDYQICTSMSIDMAVEKSKSVRAVVLIIPYAAFTNQKANYVLTLIETMRQRFPDIVTKDSNTFRVFHILITKHNSPKQVSTFRARLVTHIQEEQKNIQNLKKDADNPFSMSVSESRRSIFVAFLEMFDNKRIKFVNVLNIIQREQLLAEYLKTKITVPKQKYKKFMQNGGQKQAFFKQLSKSAHTWSVLLLYPFFNVIPDKIKEFAATVSKYKQDIIDRKQQISQIKQSEIKCKKQMQQAQEKLNKLQNPVDMNNSLHDLTVSNDIFNSSRLVIQENKSKLKKIENNLQNIQLKIKNQQKLFQLKSAKIKKIQVAITNYEQVIREMKIGVTSVKVFQLKYTHGQLITFNVGRPDGERDKAFDMVQQLKEMDTKQSIIAGQKQCTLLHLPVISKAYALVPNKGFDPGQYINNGDFNSASHKANIRSQHVILRRINYTPDKKSIVLDIEAYLKVCEDTSGLPYLIITHDIANSVINQAKISNNQSQIKSLNSQLQSQSQLANKAAKQLQDYKKTSKMINDEIQATKKQISNSETSAKQQLNNFLQNSIKLFKQNIKRYKQNILDLNKMNEEAQNSIIQTEKDLETIKFTYRRIAYLIKDQLDKQIPQSLVQFIDMALSIYQKVEESEDDAYAGAKKDYKLNFTNFSELYYQKQGEITKLIQKALTSKQYQKNNKQNPKVEMNNQLKKQIFHKDITIPIDQNRPKKKGNNNSNVSKNPPSPLPPAQSGGIFDCCCNCSLI